MSQSSVPSATLIDAALAFAAQGWPVFPCSPQSKAPLVGNDKDADGKPIPKTGGAKKATTDEAQIRAWWIKHPKALIGVATGYRRLFVVDFDPRTDAATGEVWTLDRLKGELEAQMGCALPASLTSITQSGGVHIWLTWPDDGGAEITNRGNLPLHVDVRGKGGYVIAPPSVMASGRDYHWLRRDGETHDPARTPVAQAPDALVAILRDKSPKADPRRPKRESAGGAGEARSYRALGQVADAVDETRRKWAMASLASAMAELSKTGEGDRGNRLYRVGFRLGTLVGAGVLDESMAVTGLIQACGTNGLTAKDGADLVRSNAERAVRDGSGHPRDMSDVGANVRGDAGPRGRSGRQGGESAGWQPFAPFDDADAFPPDPRPDDAGSFHAEMPSDPSEGGEGAASGGADEGGKGGRISVEPDPEKDRRCAVLPQTDLGNAERFWIRWGQDFRFCPELGWFRWDRCRWALLSEEKDKLPGEVMQAVFLTVRAIAHEATVVADSGFREVPKVRDHRLKLGARLMADGLISSIADLDDVLEEGGTDGETGEVIEPGLDFAVRIKANGEVMLFSDSLRAHARASEGKGRLEAIAALVKSMAGVLIRADAFDVDRMAINVRNGTIRIVNNGNVPQIRLFPHKRGDLITKMADVVYDPEATCDDYDRFFDRVMPDADDRRFLHQWAGLSSTGDVTYHKMAYFWGKGRNGKSTWVDTVAAILGDYAMTVSMDTFLEQQNKRKGSDATPDLARLPGVRFLRASEPEKGAKLAEGLIKSVTGGEEITARHLNKGFFAYLPSFKFTGQGNYKLKISGTDDGIWERVRLVPWTVRIPNSEIDITLPEKLKKQRSGIFNRMMAGLIDLKMNGLCVSKNVQEATAKYREASDALGRFLRDCTEDKPGSREKSSTLFAVFTAWAKASGSGEWTTQGFAKAMEDRGYERITSNGVWWQDIALTVSIEDIEAGKFGSPDDDPSGSPPTPQQGHSSPPSAWNGAAEDDSDLDDLPGWPD